MSANMLRSPSPRVCGAAVRERAMDIHGSQVPFGHAARRSRTHLWIAWGLQNNTNAAHLVPVLEIMKWHIRHDSNVSPPPRRATVPLRSQTGNGPLDQSQESGVACPRFEPANGRWVKLCGRCRKLCSVSCRFDKLSGSAPITHRWKPHAEPTGGIRLTPVLASEDAPHTVGDTNPTWRCRSLS